MYKFIVFFVLSGLYIVFNSNPVFAFINVNHNITVNNINQLEQDILGKNNFEYDIYTRVGLLEKEMFGAEQGGSLDDRVNFINNLLSAAPVNQYDYSANYNKYRRKNILKRLLPTMMHGNVTGYTPIILPKDMDYNYKIPSPQGNGINNFSVKTKIIIDD